MIGAEATQSSHKASGWENNVDNVPAILSIVKVYLFAVTRGGGVGHGSGGSSRGLYFSAPGLKHSSQDEESLVGNLLLLPGVVFRAFTIQNLRFVSLHAC